MPYWQWVKRLLLSQFTDKSERSPDVVGCDVVFTLNVLESHAPRQAANKHCYRQASAPNDGFAVTDGRIDDNAVRGGHGASDDSDLAELVESSLAQRLPRRLYTAGRGLPRSPYEGLGFSPQDLLLAVAQLINLSR